MSSFRVDLKKVVDDSYDIEIGYNLADKLIEDIKAGLVGKIKKFAVVTDSNVKDLYAENICKLLKDSGYTANLITIEAGEKSKTRQTKEFVEDTMLALEYRRDCCIIAVGGGVVLVLGLEEGVACGEGFDAEVGVAAEGAGIGLDGVDAVGEGDVVHALGAVAGMDGG